MSLSWKDNVVQNFDQKSTRYDLNCDIQKTIAQRLSNSLPDKNITDILEIGCGTGNMTKHLLAKYPNQNFCISDISPSMIKSAKAKFPQGNINWNVTDGENIKTSERYDLIVASMVFQWFEDIEVTLQTLSSLLKPNGTIFYSIPGPESFKEWKNTLKNLDLPIGILDFKIPATIYRQEEVTLQYNGSKDFLRSIKGIGAGLPRKNYTPLSPEQIKTACRSFDQNHGGTITWHVLYGKIQAQKMRNEI